MIAIAALAACGNDGSAAASVDARGSDATPRACTIDRVLGDLGLRSAPDALPWGAEGSVRWQPLVSMEGNDLLELGLYSGYGVFSKGMVVSGTYVISGDETNYATCGACLMLFGNTTGGPSEGLEVEAYYMAVEGSLQLDSIDARLIGRLDAAQFAEVTLDLDTLESTLVSGGCTTSLGSLSFDVAIAP